MADQSFAASTDSVKEAAGFVQPGELDEIAAFAPGDPENPFNWSSVSFCTPRPLLLVFVLLLTRAAAKKRLHRLRRHYRHP